MIRHIVMFKIKDEFKDEIPQLVKNFYGRYTKFKHTNIAKKDEIPTPEGDIVGEKAYLWSKSSYA